MYDVRQCERVRNDSTRTVIQRQISDWMNMMHTRIRPIQRQANHDYDKLGSDIK